MKYEEAKRIAEGAGFQRLSEESSESYLGVERTSWFLSSGGILRISEDLEHKTIDFKFFDDVYIP